MRRLPTIVVAAICSLPLVACSATPREVADTTVPGRTGSPSAPASGSGSPAPEVSAVDAAYDRMTPAQRVGQLFMIGMTATGPTQEMLDAMADHAGGNAFLRGGSDDGAEAVAAVTAQLEATSTIAGVRPFVSADQEGGSAQALTGGGFSDMPSGVTQGLSAKNDLRTAARDWAAELQAAGVNVDLAPVGDVVPAEIGVANAPIGYFRREYGATPEVAAPAVAAFVRGMQNGDVAASVKHFPGLGRATGNTDSDATATDPTVRGDALIAPFAKAVRARVAMVMVSSANYPGIDPDNRACFSPTVLRDMIRGDLGFEGVIISDSFGSASVAGTPPGERAVRFLEAGGTMVLDTNYLDLEPMTTAVLARAETNPAFAALVEADVRLVLAAKDRFGLLGP